MTVELPDVEFILNSNGITVFCPYLETPSFVPFDQKGKCPTCKSDNVEIDYVVQPEGVTIYSTRMKDKKFVAFDRQREFRDRSYMRVKTRSRPYNIPLNPLLFYPINSSADLLAQKNTVIPPPPPPPENPPDNQNV